MRTLLMLATAALLGVSAGHTAPADWVINATAIEACSCPHFCMCYFNEHPAAHHEHGEMQQYCRFNIAYKVNEGHFGAVDLSDTKFWFSGDTGGDFSQEKMDWAVLTFDKGTTAEQRQAMSEIFKHVFPVEWKSFKTDVGEIDHWMSDKNQAYATLNGGKTGEMRLKRYQGMTDDFAVLTNVKYWGTPRNDGFIMMPSELEAYREGPNAFEFKDTNGFMVTFDMNSNDVSSQRKPD
jgi:hypothetical protein